MKSVTISSLLICLLSGVTICAFLVSCSKQQANPADPFAFYVHSFSNDELSRKLQGLGFNGAQVYSGERTSDGNGLLIFGHIRGQSGDAVWVVKDRSIRCVRSPNGFPYVTEDGRLIGWSNPTNVYFADGSRLNMRPENTSVSVDVSGRYFVVVTKHLGSWLGRVGKGTNAVWRSDNFAGYRLQTVGNTIFLFDVGTAINPTCLVLADDGLTINLEKRIELKGYAGMILDVDPSGEALLVRRGDPEFSSYYVYNIRSGKWARSYTPPRDWSVFVRSDLFAQTGRLVLINDNGQTN